MFLGWGLPHKPGEERVVVGTLVTQSLEPAGLQVSLVEDVVDAEPESVGVIGDAGTQPQFVVGVAETHAAEPAHGIGEGRVVEVAAHDHVAGNTVYSLGREVGLLVSGPGGIDEFGEQMLLHLVDIVGIGVCGYFVIELFVGLCETYRLHVLVDDGNLAVVYLYLVGRYGTRFGIDGIEEQAGRILREEIHAVARGYAIGIPGVDTVYLFGGNLQSGVGVVQLGALLQAHHVGILGQDEREGAVLWCFAPLIVEHEIGVVGHEGETWFAVVGLVRLVYGAVAGYASPSQDESCCRDPYEAGFVGEPYKKKGDAYKEVEGEEQLEQYANTGGAVGRVGPHDEEQSPQRIEKQ